MTITIEKLKYLIKDNLKDNNHKDTILEQLDFLFKEKKYTENQAKQIWKAGQEYWKTSGASITFEELTERMIKQPKTEWDVEIIDEKLKLKQ